MGALQEDARSGGGDVTRRIHFGSRRTVLCALVLNALLWLVCSRLGRGPLAQSWARLGLWALFAWSVVVTAFAVYTYVTARAYGRDQAPPTSLTDPLTGLPNRKGLLAALADYDAEVERYGKRVRLIDVDLVNLNKVNYEFGQMVGDIVLQDIADVLRRNVRQDDLLCRLGGDEFLIIVPEATASDVEALAQSIESGVTDYHLSLGERGEVSGIKATVSVADYLPDKESLHETVVSAKEATAHGRLAEMAGEEEMFYHVPRVTLGAFAMHRWQNVAKKDQDEFKGWQREPNDAFTERMVSDIVRVLDEKAETHWADFVTVAEPVVDAVIDRGDGALLVSDVISSGILERRCVKKLSAAGAHVQVAAWAAY
ncbi:MAG: GGDEF domain-containing protein [Planctomycetota bacterium]